jgi:hypothetical protein
VLTKTATSLAETHFCFCRAGLWDDLKMANSIRWQYQICPCIAGQILRAREQSEMGAAYTRLEGLLPSDPKKITVTGADGSEITGITSLWDSLGKASFLSFENNPDGIKVAFEW